MKTLLKGNRMKKLLIVSIVVGMLIGAGGCGLYCYQPSKTLAECVRDGNECMYDANKHCWNNNAFSLCLQCMEVRGYTIYDSIEKLPSGTRTQQIGSIPPYILFGAGNQQVGELGSKVNIVGSSFDNPIAVYGCPVE